MGPIRVAISILILQKQVAFIMSSRPTLVALREGDSVDFTCKYYPVAQNNSKFFCKAKPACESYLIRTNPPERWVTNGRFSLHDNTTADQFVVHMDSLDPDDSGTYWCVAKMPDNPDLITVFHLNVTETSNTKTVHTVTRPSPGLPSRPNIFVDKRNLPMFVTVVSCLSALVFVLLFTLCLIFTVRKRRHSQQIAREMSEDYEVMKSGVLPEPCICPDCETFSNDPQNPPPGDSLCTNQRQSKQTESMAPEPLTQEKGLGRFSQYQDLDLSSVEEHIYHGINFKLAQM
ncbi:hypothetical protein NQD34_000324 [Periophthalmus magnuspinnatus]|uniref:CMRF35-like molecule 2 n=1 Tax=Periophthalmus magnuspinnatus TaxID=409849 RepID=UPI0022C7357F|nr:CMRF35-like molecule 2 [Periophthalmus magnuspinnatus]KAJ0033217.1 hypothetical protein NQD34_000324 [Periophthalmus magnuspinnatus]